MAYSKSSRWLLIAGIVLSIGAAIAVYKVITDDSILHQTPGDARTTEKGCGTELQCAVKKVIGNASAYCKRPIEELAVYSVKWVDAEVFESRVGRFKWLNQDKGTITFVGDKAQFQNASGTYMSVTYECDFDPAANAVLDVRVRASAIP